MISIVVPAHNEGTVLARTLRPWLASLSAHEISVVVVCNGCSDDTAQVARNVHPAVQVIETTVPSKTNALNLGDQASATFPRIYIDADIVVPIETVRALASRLERGDVLAAAPIANINLDGCSWLVRKYYDIRSRLPSAREGIGGSGVYALSDAGRRRFDRFPDVIADDTFVRLHFKQDERETLTAFKSTVFPPRTIQRLLAIRTRAHMGTLELRQHFPQLRGNNADVNDRTLLALFNEPGSWAGLLVYCCVNLMARRKAAVGFRRGTRRWQRDETSRISRSDSSAQ